MNRSDISANRVGALIHAIDKPACRAENGAMGDVINLRTVRKAKARAEAAATAATNRAAHGRTKAEKSGAESERSRRDTLLDGASIERPKDGGE